MPDKPSLLSDLKDGVMTITLNRPKVNAFNFELIAAAQEAFKQAERSDQVRCVVFTGAGDTFSAGQDITVIEQQRENAGGPSYRRHLLHTYNPLVMQIRRLEKPVLAAVNGAASGAALGLVLACDLRIAADTARFVVGFGGIGLAPDSAVSLFLPALIGLGRAAEFAFSNAPISAEQALAWGLVNRVVPPEELLPQCRALAMDMLSVIPRMLVDYKKLIDDGFAASFGEGLAIEGERARAANGSVSADDIERRRVAMLERARSLGGSRG